MKKHTVEEILVSHYESLIESLDETISEREALLRVIDESINELWAKKESIEDSLFHLRKKLAKNKNNRK